MMLVHVQLPKTYNELGILYKTVVVHNQFVIQNIKYYILLIPKHWHAQTILVKYRIQQI